MSFLQELFDVFRSRTTCTYKYHDNNDHSNNGSDDENNGGDDNDVNNGDVN